MAMGLSHPYIKSVLGQQDIPEYVPSSDDDATELLLRADSLWQRGNTDECLECLNKARCTDGWDGGGASNEDFASGLEHLANGRLDDAYDAFVRVARAAANSDDDDALAVFASERAVNIAFWMSCVGKMDAATEPLLVGKHADTVPYAGGILSFVQHMRGDSTLAEQTARRAIGAGFDDPWTLHSVAHCMYSLGRIEECADWLRMHREAVKECSTFMRTHFEFHLALCLIDLKDTEGLTDLLKGPLWGSLSDTEKEDYWAATGVLNVLWKAELRGLLLDQSGRCFANDALQHLEKSATVSRSKVFALCILRWATGEFRTNWQEKLLVEADGHDVLKAMVNAVSTVHPTGEEEYVSSDLNWREASSLVAPVADRLSELGASPEQREVLEEFVGNAVLKSKPPPSSDPYDVDISAWLKRNQRPGVSYYDPFVDLEQKQCK